MTEFPVLGGSCARSEEGIQRREGEGSVFGPVEVGSVALSRQLEMWV